MPKMKTHRGAAKRFRLSATGKIRRRKAFRSHILEKKSPKRKRSFSKMTTVAKSDDRAIRTLLGG